MKISNILFALLLILSISCGNKKANGDHGHEHATEEEHGHPHKGEDADDHHQEEFKVKSDSMEHSHDDGTTHNDH